MISVLLYSRNLGMTSWAAVRGSKVIRVTGMESGDLVKISLRGNGHDGVAFFFREKECEAMIPDGVTHVMAEHIKISEVEGLGVCVDLE